MATAKTIKLLKRACAVLRRAEYKFEDERALADTVFRDLFVEIARRKGALEKRQADREAAARCAHCDAPGGH